MPADYFLKPATIDLPKKQTLSHFVWQNVYDPKIRDALAEETQALHFSLALLRQLHFTPSGNVSASSLAKPVSWTVRASLIRQCVLQIASIAEACLWDHAIQRNARPPRDEKRWSLGVAFSRWEHDGRPKPEIAPIWAMLQEIKSIRDHVHLHQKTKDASGNFQWLNDNEKRLITDIKIVLAHLQALPREHTASTALTYAKRPDLTHRIAKSMKMRRSTHRSSEEDD